MEDVHSTPLPRLPPFQPNVNFEDVQRALFLSPSTTASSLSAAAIAAAATSTSTAGRRLLLNDDESYDGGSTNDDNTYDTDAVHDIVLIVVPKIAATLSILASVWLILEIAVYSKNKMYYVYHKLVLSMAVYTLLGSLWYWVGLNWTSSKSSSSSSVGDIDYDTDGDKFCQSQGFMIQISMLGTAIYFCMLFLYYVLVISCSYSEDQLTTTLRSLATTGGGTGPGVNAPSVNHSRHASSEYDRHNARAKKIRQYVACIFCSFDWERLFHAAPLITSAATAIAAVPLDLFHPVLEAVAVTDRQSQHVGVSSTWCWIASPTYPYGTYDDDMDRAGAFQWAFYLGPAWTCFGIMLVSLFIVYRGVASQEERMKKYVTTAQKNSQNPNRLSEATKLTSFIRPPAAAAAAATANGGGVGGAGGGTTPTTTTTITSNSDHHQDAMVNSVSQTKNTSESEINVMSSHSNSTQPNTTIAPISTAHESHGSAVDVAETPSVRSNVSSPLANSWTRLKVSLSSTCCISAFKDYWDHRPRTRQVVVQAMCYVGSFFWCNVFLTINQSLAWRRNGRVPYALLLLQVLYQPLLGFFILLSYRRPTYMRTRRKGQSRWKSLLTSLEWNSHPVEKPRQQRRISATSVAASGASKRVRKEQKRLKKERQKQLRDQNQTIAEERRETQRTEMQRKIHVPRLEEQKRRASAPTSSLHGSVGAMESGHASQTRRPSFLESLNESEDCKNNGLAEDQTPPSVDATQRSVSESVLPSMPADDYGDVGSWESTQSPTDDSAEVDRIEETKRSYHGKIPNESFSTLSSRRQSEFSREGSSKQFRSTMFEKEDSARLSDLIGRRSSEELSFTLEDIMDIDEKDEDETSLGEDGDDDLYDSDDDDLDTTNREDEESTVASLQDGGQRRLGFNIFGRREQKDSFRLVKKQSERYMDLCAMDIIPEADGAIEEKWRQIQSQSTRYERGKHERHKLHMSVPVISDRNLAGLTRPSPPPRNVLPSDKRIRLSDKEAEEGRQSASRDSPRFSWSKLTVNPLFKISGRWRNNLPSAHNRLSMTSPNTSSSSIGFRDSRGSATSNAESLAPSRIISNVSASTIKKGVGRTSSGGYFVGTAEKDRPDDQFWAKILLEKKRKDVLKAISSRFVGSNSDISPLGGNSDDFDKINAQQHDEANGESKESTSHKEDAHEADSIREARRSLEDARRDLERSISMRQVQEAMMVDQNLQLEMEDLDLETGQFDGDGDQLTLSGMYDRPGLTKSNSGSRWLERARQDIVNTVNRLSSRSLDNIPEVSEHSHMDSPKQNRKGLLTRAGGAQRRNGSQRRISSGEFSNRRSSTSSEFVAESSTELSTVGSTRTSKRSNRHRQRISDASSDGVSSSQVSAELSFVSDTPMSDDDFMSETSADVDADGVEMEDGCADVTRSTPSPSSSTPFTGFHRNSSSSHDSSSSNSNSNPFSEKDSSRMPAIKNLSRRSMFSCSSMERLSERSMEDYMSESSRSFHIDTSDMFKTGNSSFAAPQTVDESVQEDLCRDDECQNGNDSKSSEDTEHA